MSEILRQGLLITAIGMGLVFAVIIFLWGLMALMMRLTSVEKKEKKNLEEPIDSTFIQEGDDALPEQQMQQIEEKRRAAAAAVAVALAMKKNQTHQKDKLSAEKQGKLSPWQTVHRMRQLGKRN